MLKEKEKVKFNSRRNGLDCMRRIAAKAYGKKLLDEQVFNNELKSFNNIYKQEVTPSQVLFWALIDQQHVLVEQIYDFVMSDMKETAVEEKNPDIRDILVVEVEIIDRLYFEAFANDPRKQ